MTRLKLVLVALALLCGAAAVPPSVGAGFTATMQADDGDCAAIWSDTSTSVDTSECLGGAG